MMNRSAQVFYLDRLAGTISEDEDGYTFRYDHEYLKDKNALPISISLPCREEPYRSKTMIPFFDGLIPEGWLLHVVEENWKISARDRMGLLLACCKDCIGAVSIIPDKETKDEDA